MLALSKAGFRWPPAYLTENNMAIFEKDFLYRLTPCKKGSIQKVSQILAEIHAELLLVHPFRDGMRSRTEGIS
jgi:cell filamentation protein